MLIKEMQRSILDASDNQDRASFIRQILDHPDDATLHLVFSDWLDENGEEMLAENIRLMIDLEELKCERRISMRLYEKDVMPPAGFFKDCMCPSCLKHLNWLSLFDRKEFIDRYRQLPFGTAGRHWFRYGLITKVWVPVDQFNKHSSFIYENWPIEKVYVTDIGRFRDQPVALSSSFQSNGIYREDIFF